jgi:hypothetical protein
MAHSVRFWLGEVLYFNEDCSNRLKLLAAQLDEATVYNPDFLQRLVDAIDDDLTTRRSAARLESLRTAIIHHMNNL